MGYDNVGGSPLAYLVKTGFQTKGEFTCSSQHYSVGGDCR